MDRIVAEVSNSFKTMMQPKYLPFFIAWNVVVGLVLGYIAFS